MKFYNRDDELKSLSSIRRKSKKSSQMTFLVGRRRIGKTKLILEAFKSTRFVYFFVSRKSEALLCKEFCLQLESGLNIKVHGTFESFSNLFAYIMELSKTINFTLAIDEFQAFYNINKSVYSGIQNIWDQNKDVTKLNLVLSGSIYSLMYKIFEDAKEPLYGRANHKIKLTAFNIDVLHQIFKDYKAPLTSENMLAFYAVTGGVPKYVELLTENKAFDLDSILTIFFENNSIFSHEGKDLLIEEFGKDYTIYFSILSLIANSKTSRSEMESILGRSVGGYLEKLEKDYSLIKMVKPIFAKPNSRTQKYLIDDLFLCFWFRYCYKYQSALELQNIEYIKNIILDDYQSYSGKILERYFIEKLKQTKKYNLIGTYWELKNLNEIDVIAINEHKKLALIAEVKRNGKKINIATLKTKAEKLVRNKLNNYKVIYQGFSLDDI